MAMAIAATASPTISDIRAPLTTRENTSRPNWSVPKSPASLQGALSRFIGFNATGSTVKNGPMMATSTISSSRMPPHSTLLLRSAMRHRLMSLAGGGAAGADTV